jgi:hypothetical protein
MRIPTRIPTHIPTHRTIRRTLLAVGITLIVLPAAVSDGHQLTPQQAKVVHHAH